MDSRRFDDLLRALAESRSRRGIAHTLAGMVLAGSLLGLEAAEAKRKRKRKKRKKNRNKTTTTTTTTTTTAPPQCSPACAGGKICVSGACVCPAEQEECKGQCVPACTAPSVRNPFTCECCVPAGEACGIASLCCPEISQCGTVCRGGEEGNSCQFDAQCQPPLKCNSSGECRPV